MADIQLLLKQMLLLLFQRQPFLRVQCEPFFYFPHCTLYFVQSAQLCLWRSVVWCVLSARFWTPRLALCHLGSFMSAHDLKRMRTQGAPLFNTPHGSLRNRGQVPFPRIHRVFWLGVELTTLRLQVRLANRQATLPLMQMCFVSPCT